MTKKTIIFLALACSGALQAQRMDNVATHSKYIQAVDEYLPAPGQFVNTMPVGEAGDSPATMAAKCSEYISGEQSSPITLGAYGGYVTFHFDHSIANIPGRRDLYIKGNAYVGNSEPGVVMVSKDVNGNGLPDDPWYEIAGSADSDSAGLVVYDYEITYTPNPLGDITWTDNQGHQGTVDRNSFHDQEYFPIWHEGALTFHGTLLPRNAENQGSNGSEYWVLSTFRYGYADNAPNSDVESCSIDLSWAVDANRQPVALDFVDFVRVYNGENQKCGWIGETSTEVSGAEDLHLEESIQAITTYIQSATSTTPPTVVSRHSLDGRAVDSSYHGIQVIRYSNGETKTAVKR